MLRFRLRELTPPLTHVRVGRTLTDYELALTHSPSPTCALAARELAEVCSKLLAPHPRVRRPHVNALKFATVISPLTHVRVGGTSIALIQFEHQHLTHVRVGRTGGQHP